MASRRWKKSYPGTPIGKARAKIDGLVKVMHSVSKLCKQKTGVACLGLYILNCTGLFSRQGGY